MREGFLTIGGRETWYRTYGERTDRPPLLMLHGGPGGASPNDVPFVARIARERLVVQYDQLESGRSQRLGDPSVLTTENFIAELNAIRAALDLDAVHLWGESWGGMLAMEYALTHPAGLRSIVSASGPHSVPLWLESATALREQLPPTNLWALERCERTLRPRKFKAGQGPRSDKVAKQAALMAKLSTLALSPTLQAVDRAMTYVRPLRRIAYPLVGLVFSSRHTIRRWPVPAGAAAEMVAMNQAVYEHLWGPSEFHATGPLRAFDITDRLHEIDVPMLFTSGAHEILRPEHVRELVARVPDVRWELFADSAHASPFEEPQRYTNVLAEFLTKVDARSPQRRAVPGS